VAHALHDRGYSTSFFGKWHLARRDRTGPLIGEAHARVEVPPEARGGFDLWEGFESGFLVNDPWLHGTRLPEPRHFKGYQADVLLQRAAEWLRRPQARPVFCFVSLESPHPPYHAPAPHVTTLEPRAVMLDRNVPRGTDIEVKARAELSGYYAHIEATDRAIGRMLAEVDLAETIVVFTSVHGDMHGAHGLFRKGWPYEESIRVPLLIRDRRSAKRPRVDASAVSLVDLPHMAVAWAEGLTWHCKRDSAPISMPSVPPFPLQCDRVWKGFRSQKHKLILNGDGSPWLYFDLEHDPHEMQNLAGQPDRRAEIENLRQLI
jgi:arylsulfatase A-like enzyme